MDVYILKFTACLALFVLFYKLFLETQQMHQFKRYYLLASIVFAISVPFITFTEYVELTQPIENFQINFEPVYIPQHIDEPQGNYIPIMLWSIYGLGVLLFLTKFILNLSRIFSKIRKNERKKSQSFIYVLLNDLVIPHSFFSYIFLNKKEYKLEQIPKEVLIHEQTHAKQKHSLDVLAIELLQIVFWFHPLIYILKHAIKLNHEFLADEAVIYHGAEPSAYQQLLIAFSSNASRQELASAINYSSIKKRFTVMNTHTSKQNIWLRSIVLLPLIAFSIYGFSEKVEVVKTTSEINKNQNSTPVLHIEQDPLKLTLNGKPSSLKNLNKDFKEATAGQLSDLRIESNDPITMTFIESLAEVLKPNLSKIYLKTKLEIVDNRVFDASKENLIELKSKPLLKLMTNVNADCNNCTLDKDLVKNAYVTTSNNEDVESFTVKILSNPSISVRGNKFNKEVLKQIESMYNDDQLMIFDIKTNTKNIEGSMLINVKTQQQDSSKKVKVIKGGDWKDVEQYLKQDKKVINDIHIHIDKNEQLFLNNKSVTLNTLAEKVNALNTHLSNDEKRKFVHANVTYDDESHTSLVDEIMFLLPKKCNVYSSSAMSIDSHNKLKSKSDILNPYVGKSVEEAKKKYEDETLDFSVKEQPKGSPWEIKLDVNEVTYTPLDDDEPIKVKITEEELKEYNAIVKKFNALPKDKRIIKLKDFERMSYIYSHLSDEQKKSAEPYPDFYKELSKD